MYKEVRESFLTGLLHPIRAALCGAEVTETHTCGERIHRQVTRGGTRVAAPPRVASEANPASASAAGNSPQTLHPPRPAWKPPVLVPVSCKRLLLQPGSPCAQRERPQGSHIAGRLRLRRRRPLPHCGGQEQVHTRGRRALSILKRPRSNVLLGTSRLRERAEEA